MLCAGVAQLVVQLICNQQVGGSNPSTSSIKKPTNGLVEPFVGFLCYLDNASILAKNTSKNRPGKSANKISCPIKSIPIIESAAWVWVCLFTVIEKAEGSKFAGLSQGEGWQLPFCGSGMAAGAGLLLQVPWSGGVGVKTKKPAVNPQAVKY